MTLDLREYRLPSIKQTNKHKWHFTYRSGDCQAIIKQTNNPCLAMTLLGVLTMPCFTPFGGTWRLLFGWGHSTGCWSFSPPAWGSGMSCLFMPVLSYLAYLTYFFRCVQDLVKTLYLLFFTFCLVLFIKLLFYFLSPPNLHSSCLAPPM